MVALQRRVICQQFSLLSVGGGVLLESAGPGVWAGLQAPLARPTVFLAMVAPLRSAGRVSSPRGLIHEYGLVKREETHSRFLCQALYGPGVAAHVNSLFLTRALGTLKRMPRSLCNQKVLATRSRRQRA